MERLGQHGSEACGTGFGSVQLLRDLLPDPRIAQPVGGEHLPRDTISLPDETEQEMLGPDVIVTELQRLPQRQLEHLLGAGRERDVSARYLLTVPDDLVDGDPQFSGVRAEGGDRPHGDAGIEPQDAEQEVLGADVVMIVFSGFVLRVDDDPPGFIGKPLKHLSRPNVTSFQRNAGPEVQRRRAYATLTTAITIQMRATSGADGLIRLSGLNTTAVAPMPIAIDPSASSTGAIPSRPGSADRAVRRTGGAGAAVSRRCAYNRASTRRSISSPMRSTSPSATAPS